MTVEGRGQVGDIFLNTRFSKVLTFGTLLILYIHKNNKIIKSRRMGIKSKIAFKQKQISLADFLINNKTKPKGESKALTKTQK